MGNNYLKIKKAAIDLYDKNGNKIQIDAIRGEKGDKGDKGDTGADGRLWQPTDAEKQEIAQKIINTVPNEVAALKEELSEYVIKDKSINLFNASNDVNGYAMGANGVPFENTPFSYNYVPVEYGKTYIMSGCSFHCYYCDADKKIISIAVETISTINNVSINVNVQNCKFICVNYRKDKHPNFMFVEGDTLPTMYIPYSENYKLSPKIKISDEQFENGDAFAKIHNSVNLFDDSKTVDGYAIGSNGVPFENAAYSYNYVEVESGKSYIMSGCSFYCYLCDSDKKIIKTAVETTSTIDNVRVYADDDNAVYVCVNYRKDKHPEFMFVEGDVLPTEYIPHLTMLDENISVYSNRIIKKIYQVGKNRKYKSLTAVLRELKNNTDEKIIYIDSGTYDEFEAIGGYSFVNSIPSDATDYRKYCVIVPPNTTIIGLGAVDLVYMPSNVVNQVAQGLISPLNIEDGNVHVENITITCKKCRYAIHDQAITESRYGYTHSYKNVVCVKDSATTQEGNSQAFGCGIHGEAKLEFDNCRFESHHAPFSVHNGSYGSIIINNSIFRNLSNQTGEPYPTIRFGNVNGVQSHILVNISNSYIGNKIKVGNETATERPNAFDVTVLNCTGDPSVFVTCATNIYEPKIFN